MIDTARTPPGEHEPSASGPRLAGYRVLRRVADRQGARVFHAAVDDTSGVRTSATIMVFDGDRGDELATRLVDRLEFLGGVSIPSVLDVCLDGDGHPAVVLDFCGDLLSSILVSGTRLSGGEVVTLVAPVFTAVLAVHDRGFVHGGISRSSIAIGRNGRPVLLGCDHADDVRGRGDRRERNRRAAEDIRAFADLLDDLAEAVIDGSERRRTQTAAAKIRDGASDPFSTSFRSAAEVRLFEIAEPTPLMFTKEVEDPTGAASEQVARSLVPSETRRRRDRGGSSARLAPHRAAVAGRRITARVSSHMQSTVRRLVVAGRSHGRRRRVVIAGTAALCAAVACTLLIPTGEPVAGQPAPKASRTSRSIPTVTADESAPGGSHDAPPTEAPAGAVSEGDQKDDAIAGTRTLLDTVARCVVEQTGGCWAAAFEPDSRLLAVVSEEGATELPEALVLPVEAVEIQQEEDFGDARLIVITPADATKPASVLMVRTEAGWRLREVFES